MKMKACKIEDLARVLINEFAAMQDIGICEIGCRPGEKLHEVLINEYEAVQAYEYGEDYYVISPTETGLKRLEAKEYSSNDELLDAEGIRRMLVRGDFI